MKRLCVAGSVICLLMLTGCASTEIKDMNAYNKVTLRETDKMPSKASLSGIKPRIVVFELADKKGSAAGDQVADAIIKELNDTKNVTIVDRTLAEKLGQEITLAETKGRSGYTGQDVADFAISGKIVSALAGIQYSAPSSWTDDKGQAHVNPATCTTSGKISYSIKLSQIPSLTTVNTFDAEASSANTQDAQFFLYCPAITPAAAKGILSQAADAAVRKIHTALKNQFAPSGYILERRIKDKDNIFKISIGRPNGANEGLKIQILTITTDTHALTGVTSTEQVKLADGVISNQIGDSFSYVIVSDAAAADKIRLGDIVKIQFENSFGDKVSNMLH